MKTPIGRFRYWWLSSVRGCILENWNGEVVCMRPYDKEIYMQCQSDEPPGIRLIVRTILYNLFGYPYREAAQIECPTREYLNNDAIWRDEDEEE